jgi:outer membrane protein TolC
MTRCSPRPLHADAGRELTQGRALLLRLDLAATHAPAHGNRTEDPPSPFERSATANLYTFTLKQPVYRPQNYATYNQADFLVKQAEATFAQASQDLAVRVVQAYLDVLAAEDTLALVGAQKAAISEQLAQAKRNFEVGTATITDTHEAQARYDLIASQEIAAQNERDQPPAIAAAHHHGKGVRPARAATHRRAIRRPIRTCRNPGGSRGEAKLRGTDSGSGR